MPTIPKGPGADKSGQFLLSLEREAQQHARLDEALAALARGVKLDELPDHLLFALAPHVDISRFIHAWVARLQRAREVPAEESLS